MTWQLRVQYPLTIFLSAFLLFQVQPLLAKVILPWFGGGTAVWTTCLLFFQVVLLVGYGYAHLLASRVSTHRQPVIHIGLLLAALLFLPLDPDGSWRSPGGEDPAWRVLGLLAATVGLPYLMLSSTAPLVQSWYGRSQTASSPYRLYALSNAGSLLALFSYPFLVEPFATVRFQLASWSVGFAIFALLCSYSSWAASRGSRASTTGGSEEQKIARQSVAERPRLQDVLMWLGLSAAPSILLLATTQQISQEISVVPFLWVLPLGLYLSSFILCFDSDRWYRRRVFAPLLPLSCLAAGGALVLLWEISLLAQLFVFASALFFCCMACHGELSRSRPRVEHLTLFYLCVSAGGALGGVFCTAVATQIFSKYWELHVGFAACMVLALLSVFRDPSSELAGGRPRWAWAGLIASSLAAGAVLVADAASEFEQDAEVVERTRSFYGVLTVYRMEDRIGPFYALDHGRIRHGVQYLDPERRRQASSYYHPETGVGLAMRLHPARPARRTGGRAGEPFRIGVIGLGAGSLAIYGEKGDTLRFYELDPEVVRLARQHFRYLDDARSDVSLVVGDARVEMERELASGKRQLFDVLAVDAFSGDGVPMHLVTREAFELYGEHLAPDGILAVNITNVYIDLRGLVRGTARELGYDSLWVDWSPGKLTGFEPNSWILVTRNQAFLETPIVKSRTVPWSKDPTPDIVWTDDYGALFQVLRD